jgi:hypothetical protein
MKFQNTAHDIPASALRLVSHVYYFMNMVEDKDTVHDVPRPSFGQTSAEYKNGTQPAPGE